jgi:excisionase family DNA binding protein
MSTIATPRPLLTVPEAARRLRVSEKTIRRRIARGEIPAVQLGGPRSPVRIPEDELERWLFGNPGEAA